MVSYIRNLLTSPLLLGVFVALLVCCSCTKLHKSREEVAYNNCMRAANQAHGKAKPGSLGEKYWEKAMAICEKGKIACAKSLYGDECDRFRLRWER